ncbi:none [Leptomonas seymouri]|uniref:None n=1 Tax=Leptomonas seymouri TaxID=5684 RepID=A0A0N1I2I7_LEPSE|nr:none [Leptomonas seymouri]|eukprot:KPI85763.1 none [Leptomonas seymouri]
MHAGNDASRGATRVLKGQRASRGVESLALARCEVRQSSQTCVVAAFILSHRFLLVSEMMMHAAVRCCFAVHFKCISIVLPSTGSLYRNALKRPLSLIFFSSDRPFALQRVYAFALLSHVRNHNCSGNVALRGGHVLGWQGGVLLRFVGGILPSLVVLQPMLLFFF